MREMVRGQRWAQGLVCRQFFLLAWLRLGAVGTSAFLGAASGIRGYLGVPTVGALAICQSLRPEGALHNAGARGSVEVLEERGRTMCRVVRVDRHLRRSSSVSRSSWLIGIPLSSRRAKRVQRILTARKAMPTTMANQDEDDDAGREEVYHTRQSVSLLSPFRDGGREGGDLQCWSKLNFATELNKLATVPGEPDWEVDTTKGMNDAPSNRADEALPKDESDSVLDIIKTRSGSMVPLIACVFCGGIMANCEISTTVTGPERTLPSPTDGHVLLDNVYETTFACVLSASAIEPAAVRESLCKQCQLRPAVQSTHKHSPRRRRPPSKRRPVCRSPAPTTCGLWYPRNRSHGTSSTRPALRLNVGR